VSGNCLCSMALTISPRQQLVDPVHLVVGGAAENIGKPSLRINAIELGCFDKRVSMADFRSWPARSCRSEFRPLLRVQRPFRIYITICGTTWSSDPAAPYADRRTKSDRQSFHLWSAILEFHFPLLHDTPAKPLLFLVRTIRYLSRPITLFGSSLRIPSNDTSLVAGS
jgi:hypothetical protein